MGLSGSLMAKARLMTFRANMFGLIVGIALCLLSIYLIVSGYRYDETGISAIGFLFLVVSIFVLAAYFVPDKDKYRTIECQEYKVEEIYSVIDKDTVTTYKIYYK